MKRQIIPIMCLILALSLASCGSNKQSVKINAPGVVSQTEMITEAHLIEIGAINKEQEVSENTEKTGSKKGTDYEYKNYVLTKAGKSNAVFSGEAFATQLDILQALSGEIKMADGEETTSHLSLGNTNDMTRLNRVWVNEGVSFCETESTKGLSYAVDMQSPSVITERNEWLSNGTNGYMTSLPVLFSEDAQADITSVLYFHDTWKGGSKPYDTKTRPFKNADGSSNEVTMIRDNGDKYYQLSNARAYKMEFTNGNYMMVVLPDDEVELKDVDLSALMSDQIAAKQAHVKFYIPEIEVESSYALNLKDFGLQSVRLINETQAVSETEESNGKTTAKQAVSKTEESNSKTTAKQAVRSSGINPSFTHTAKLSFTPYGACIDSSENKFIEIPETFDDDLNIINFICDKPFMYYVYDAINNEIAFFGVINKMGDKVVTATSEPVISKNDATIEEVTEG